MKKIIPIILVNLAVLVALVIVLEFLGQAAFYLKTGRWLFKGEDTEFVAFHRKLYERHPFLGAVVRSGAAIEYEGKQITILEDGTRWTGAKALPGGQIRVALLGGSTTFGTQVTDEESWPAQLQEFLGDQYLVKNFGIPGFDSTQSLIQLMLIVSEYQPHVVVLYTGWNDIAHYHIPGLGPDFSAGGVKQVETTMNINFYDYKESFLERFFKTSAWGKFTRILQSRIMSASEKNGHQERDDPDPFVDRIYLRNLSYMVSVARSFASRPQILIVPQVLNESRFIASEGSSSWSKYVKNKSMPALMKRFNGLLNQACQEGDQQCRVVNEILEVDWETGDFVDYGHLNAAGGKKFTGVIGPFIAKGNESPQP